jgi:hypothetical protein
MIKIEIMKNYLFILFVVAMVFNTHAQTTTKTNNQTSFSKNNIVSNSYTYKIIESPNKTFGYEIYADKKLMIKQTTIPGRQGNQGFTTHKQAQTIAKIVTQKLQKGIMPPSITADELLKAGVK